MKSSPAPTPSDHAAQKRMRQKRGICIGIGILCAAGLVSGIVLQHPEWLLPQQTEQKTTSMYSDRIVSYTFYPTDYDLDVTKDAEYMGLDRCLYFKNGNETIGVPAGDGAAYGAAVAFFDTYFQTVIAGDTDTYNTFFTDAYLAENKLQTRFAPQMLYDILIEQLWTEPQSNGDVQYGFNVSYKIHRNDGTFRNDIDSDASKTLYFELTESGGVVQIHRITYYVR